MNWMHKFISEYILDSLYELSFDFLYTYGFHIVHVFIQLFMYLTLHFMVYNSGKELFQSWKLVAIGQVNVRYGECM